MPQLQDSRRGRPRLAHVALALALATSVGACAPAAIGTMVVGGAGVVTGIVTYEDCDVDDNKDGPSGALCGLNNVLPILLGVIGGAMIIGGGISLAK
ncbi:MAG: hypothetical protein R3B48_28360 [Kofleriaceae bacterium]